MASITLVERLQRGPADLRTAAGKYSQAALQTLVDIMSDPAQPGAKPTGSGFLALCSFATLSAGANV
jgi:hypothetical protein